METEELPEIAVFCSSVFSPLCNSLYCKITQNLIRGHNSGLNLTFISCELYQMFLDKVLNVKYVTLSSRGLNKNNNKIRSLMAS